MPFSIQLSLDPGIILGFLYIVMNRMDFLFFFLKTSYETAAEVQEAYFLFLPFCSPMVL